MSNNNAADKAKEKAEEAKDLAEQGKQTLVEKLKEDGVYAMPCAWNCTNPRLTMIQRRPARP